MEVGDSRADASRASEVYSGASDLRFGGGVMGVVRRGVFEEWLNGLVCL